MQNNRFVVLTGHLSNYPLSDLVGILRHQRKSGRLLIEYPKGPAMFFFQDGELIDARLNDLTGLQAICVAIAPTGSFIQFQSAHPKPTPVHRAFVTTRSSRSCLVVGTKAPCKSKAQRPRRLSKARRHRLLEARPEHFPAGVQNS